MKLGDQDTKFTDSKMVSCGSRFKFPVSLGWCQFMLSGMKAGMLVVFNLSSRWDCQLRKVFNPCCIKCIPQRQPAATIFKN